MQRPANMLLAISILAAVAATAWLARFDLAAAGPGSAYLLDRWTGELRQCTYFVCDQVERR